MTVSGRHYLEYNQKFFTPLAGWYDHFALASRAAVRGGLDLAGPLAGRTVIDLCTGTGAVAREAARRGARVLAVDACPAMLEKARAWADGNPEVELRLASVDELPDAELAGADLVTISLGLHDMPQGFRAGLLAKLAGAGVARLLVIDYGFPANPVLNRLYMAVVASFETVFFPQFMKSGGIEGQLARAGFSIQRRTWFFPGFFEAVLAVPAGAGP